MKLICLKKNVLKDKSYEKNGFSQIGLNCDILL